MELPDPPFLLVTDRRQSRRSLEEIVAAALGAGCRWISLREKDLPPDEQIVLARSLLPRAHANGAKLVMHADAALAARAGADGVHLPSGRDAAAARAASGRIGLLAFPSIPCRKRRRLNPSQVDYVLAGPAFETASKPGYGPEIGRKGLAEITKAARVPVLAIGGVNAARLASLLLRGRPVSR